MKVKKDCSCPIFSFFILLAGVFLIEIFVFNFRHWISPGNSTFSSGVLQMGNGYVDDGNSTYRVVDGSREIELIGLDCELDTAWIEITVLNHPKEELKPIRIRQFVTDESHKLYYELPERELWETEKRSNYMSYHLYGRCRSLKILPDVVTGQVISFQLILNPKIPLFISWERICVLALLAAAVWWLRPVSGLHRISCLHMNYRKKMVLLSIFFLLHMGLFWSLVNVNSYFHEEKGDNHKQYQALAEALKEGSFSLLYEPPKALKNMENPYDFAYRSQVMEESGGEWYKWDHAYYEGKYYVYFGVVPAVMFYLPYYIITGGHLHNYILLFWLALLFLAGVMGTVYEIIRKWFSRTSLAVWFLITELTLLGSGIIYMLKRPDLYTVPILSGLAFGMIGLWCFLRAEKEGKLLPPYLAAGSFFTALIAGCRPQLFVFVLLPLLFIGGKGIKNNRRAIPSCIIPMLVVAGMLMYYNHSRFGSVFDFGANYNLTFNDMRMRGWEWERIPLGVHAYLFQPIKLIARFPFMEAVYFDSQYMGVTIQEATFGGIFMTHLFSWAALLPVLFHRQLKKCGKMPWMLSVVCLLQAGIVILVDTNMSGILQRYFGDFSIFIMLSAVFSVLLLFEHEKISGSALKRVAIWGLVVCLLLEVGYQGMMFFLDTGEALSDLRPDLYAHFKYLTAFWL